MKPSFNSMPRTGSLFLDQLPELQSAIKDWLKTLDMDPGAVAYGEPSLDEIECRSRDGFIRASHNFGGFDITWLTEVSTCAGSGQGPDLVEIDRQESQSYLESVRWFKDQAFIGLEHLADDEITYSNLCEIGRSDLAEQLSEVEREWQDTPIYWGIRAMYEGQDTKGVHVLMLYVSGNVSDYHGAHGKDSEQKFEASVRFRSVSGLLRQLARLKAKVEASI